MHTFIPKDNFYIRILEFFGFDSSGKPILNEIIREGSKEPCKLTHLNIRSPLVSAEDIKEIIKIKPEINELVLPLNFDLKLNLEWLMPIADNIISIGISDGAENVQLLNEFKNVKYLRIKTGVKLNIDNLSQLVDIQTIHVDFNKFQMGETQNLLHFCSWHSKNVDRFPFHKSPKFRFLDFVWDRYLSSLDFIQDLPELEAAQLFHTSRVEEWPDSSKLHKLDSVYLENTKRLTDLRGLAKAPNLRGLFIYHKTKLKLVEPFLDCKSLKYMILPVTKVELKEARRLFPGVMFNDDLREGYKPSNGLY